MKVQINNSEMIVDENVSIRSILEITNSPTEGVAFALTLTAKAADSRVGVVVIL